MSATSRRQASGVLYDALVANRRAAIRAIRDPIDDQRTGFSVLCKKIFLARGRPLA